MAAAPQTSPSTAVPRATRGRSFNIRQAAPFIIVGIGIAGYVIYRRRKGATPNAAGTTIDPTLAAQAQNSPSASDIAQQLIDLQGAASTESAASDGVYKAPAGEKLVGSGYTAPPNSLLVKDASGATYQGITSNISAGELKKAGEQLYYQVLPGVFEPTKGALRPGTSLFYKQKV